MGVWPPEMAILADRNEDFKQTIVGSKARPNQNSATKNSIDSPI